MRVEERFLNYVAVNTQSAAGRAEIPSTPCQWELAGLLAEELRTLGVSDARVDGHCYVMGSIASNLPEGRGAPALGLIAHMDTATETSGAGVKPRIVRGYAGGPIVLNEALGVSLTPEVFPSLLRHLGEDLIVTDGTTLLGADNKAGVAEIMTAVEYLLGHPEIPHGKLCIGFTPDEEVGRGAEAFDVAAFGAQLAYTVDGGELGELEYENFNAASARVSIHGVNIHPGSAKNKMKNALLLAVELANMLPPAETPAHTEGYEGFYHLTALSGDESGAELRLIVRDHDRAAFEARKDYLRRLSAYLNDKYGAGTVELELSDSYYNMREQIEPHMYLIHRARAAMEAAGVTPVEVPIRGGTDGARLSYMGLPCPNLCTGGVNFHGVHEYIPAGALETMTQVLVNLVKAE